MSSLGVPSTSYGTLLVSVKLPQELRLIVTREIEEEEWDIDDVMKLLWKEIDARERVSVVASQQYKKAANKELSVGTATTLTPLDDNYQTCCYCNRHHSANECETVTDVNERKEILRRAGRCFICLRYVSRDCRTSHKYLSKRNQPETC